MEDILMQLEALDHVSLVTRNLERSMDFYRTVLGLERITRPAFRSEGA